MKISSSRKGFELAISTLVVMILGALIIGGGIVLLTKLTTRSVGAVGVLTQNQQHDLDALLAGNQLVATAPDTQTIVAGQTATAGIGIKNVLSDTAFSIVVVGKDKDDKTLNWKINYFNTLIVKRNEQKSAVVTVTPPKDAPTGIYSFLVTVTPQGSPDVYDSVRFFTIHVQ